MGPDWKPMFHRQEVVSDQLLIGLPKVVAIPLGRTGLVIQ